MGKLKDLASEDTAFARDERHRFNGSPEPLPDEKIPDFVKFLEHVDYIYDLREKYEIAIEMPYEIEQMNGEPDYYFPTAEETLEEVKEFAINMKGQPNVLKLIREKFPELEKDLFE